MSACLFLVGGLVKAAHALHVTACKVAHPPSVGFIARLRPNQFPGSDAGKLSSPTNHYLSGSFPTGDLRPWGALETPGPSCARLHAGNKIVSYGRLPRKDRNENNPYAGRNARSEEHTSELQSRQYLVC